MRFRFRYLGPDGSEVEVESLDGLRVLVRSGAIGELTLLHDALTREWAPARAHAVYRLLREEVDPPSGPPSTPTPPSMTEKPRRRGGGGDDQRPGDELPDLGFSVSFESPPVEPDSERVIRNLLREREQEGKPTERVDWFAKPVAWSPEPASVSQPPAPRVPVTPPPLDPIPPSEVIAPRVVEAPRSFAVTPPPERPPIVRIGPLQGWLDDALREARRLATHRSAPQALIVAGSIGLFVLLIAAARHERAAAASDEAARIAAASMVGPDLSELVARSAVARASGFQSMVVGMDSLRRVHDVEDVPPVWLEGIYLADAERYPEVEAFWTRYQGFLRDVQASDTTLFRSGFVQEAVAEGVDDGILAMRLSRAMREFKDTQPERAAVYAEMEELAGAALALHALLVERADDIEWSPAIQRGVSRAPVVEAVAQDTVLHDRMWSLMERIFASLEKLGGNLGGSRDNLTDLMLQGIEATSD